MINKTNNTLARNIVALVFLSLSIGGCATKTPTLSTDPNAEITFDGLHEVQHSAADKAWAMPGIDLSGYSKIMVQGAGIEYRPGGESGRMHSARSSSGPFEVTEEQKTRFRQVVGEVVLDELGKSEKFTLVNEPGPDVLLIRGALLDVVSYVPPEPIGCGHTGTRDSRLDHGCDPGSCSRSRHYRRRWHDEQFEQGEQYC